VEGISCAHRDETCHELNLVRDSKTASRYPFLDPEKPVCMRLIEFATQQCVWAEQPLLSSSLRSSTSLNLEMSYRGDPTTTHVDFFPHMRGGIQEARPQSQHKHAKPDEEIPAMSDRSCKPESGTRWAPSCKSSLL
jgi:hypothetical protein